MCLDPAFLSKLGWIDHLALNDQMPHVSAVVTEGDLVVLAQGESVSATDRRGAVVWRHSLGPVSGLSSTGRSSVIADVGDGKAAVHLDTATGDVISHWGTLDSVESGRSRDPSRGYLRTLHLLADHGYSSDAAVVLDDQKIRIPKACLVGDDRSHSLIRIESSGRVGLYVASASRRYFLTDLNHDTTLSGPLSGNLAVAANATQVLVADGRTMSMVERTSGRCVWAFDLDAEVGDPHILSVVEDAGAFLVAVADLTARGDMGRGWFATVTPSARTSVSIDHWISGPHLGAGGTGVGFDYETGERIGLVPSHGPGLRFDAVNGETLSPIKGRPMDAIREWVASRT